MGLTATLTLFAVVNIVVCIPLTFHAADSKRGGYRAAVYEHAVHIPWDSLIFPVSRRVAVEDMMRNIRVFEEQTALAAEKGADIIVFPEDGIYGMLFNRDTLKPFLEEIPDPREITWNPCSLPDNTPDIDVQRKLSCMARDNSIYVVANMGDRKPCNHSNDPKCPDDGQYQYNTDVVFDSAGYLIARYHKRHLFKEGQFDTPDVEVVTFETPFGSFGIFTCFDILFYQPAVELIRKQGVRNIVFPTAWMDRLPFLAAIEFHSAFAKGLGVNVLAANIHFPIYKFHGSGIYTPEGYVNYYYNDHLLSSGKLLISDIDSLTGRARTVQAKRLPPVNFVTIMKQMPLRTKDIYETRLFLQNLKLFNIPELNLSAIHSLDVLPRMDLPRENYTFVPLTAGTGTKYVCKSNVCCKAVYSKNASINDLFVLAAFSGFDDGRFTEICAVLKCPSNTEQTCGDPVRYSQTKFDFLEISGNFSTPSIFPEVLVSNGDFLGIVQDEWNFSDNTLLGEEGFSKPLLTASLFGRLYAKDNLTFT